MAADARSTKGAYEYADLLPSAARTVTAGVNGNAVTLPVAPAYAFCLDVTAAATDVGDTLDVYVQTLIGGQWVDVVHFTQVLGNGGAKRFFAKVSAGLAETMFENGTALAAGSVRNLCGDAWRGRYVLVDADADASITFQLSATPL
ncbi:MAG: hypothetical protein KBD62_35710 [Kofleriaceae bacterium]|jgi:hypothetical protein|nr:hypothetical protein [Kofleriaceae bacterium]